MKNKTKIEKINNLLASGITNKQYTVNFDNTSWGYPASLVEAHLVEEEQLTTDKELSDLMIEFLLWKKDKKEEKGKEESSVDYLINQITSDRMIKALTPSEWNEVYKKAHQLHQEEIQGAFCHGGGDGRLTEEEELEYAKKYYNEYANELLSIDNQIKTK